MLLGALAPTISRAMVPGAGARLLADVCSTAGVGFVEIDRARASLSGDTAIDREGEGGQQAHSPDRCPYCCTHAGVAVASPPATALLVASPGSVRLPRLSFVSPRPRHAWSPSHPRAPPARA
ncbi:MAG: DUF2946 domain-containing protein [Betaproteobacteria bacterium]|nr:DUF2946 domain-containing protein [Betaproteobacteria bacterium]